MIAHYRQIGLIYNPCAGALRGRGEARLQRAIAVLRAAGHGVDACPTTGPETAGAIARERIARGADLILIAGGDGTINEALQGVAGTAVPLAALPAGTANCLCCELGLGRGVERAAAKIGELEPVRVSLGLLRAAGAAPRHFLMMAGVGLDARVVREVDPDLKRRLGKFAYWVASFRLVGKRLAEFDVRANGVTRRCGFALVARGRNYGGDLAIARGASLLRRDFEAVLLEGATAAKYLKYFVGVGTATLGRMRGATILAARSVELVPAAGPVPVQVDGEYAGDLPATIEIAAGAITLLAPRRFLAAQAR